jgi:hypothetical protein
VNVMLEELRLEAFLPADEASSDISIAGPRG